ncbi:MAG: pilus assembly protein PilY [Burkholderiaceae bacterium]|nr:MAG: pilus assembly protein PilY [Burkholderiaceae bacterium]
MSGKRETTMSHVHASRRLDAHPRVVARAVALLCASLAVYSSPLMAGVTEIDNEPLATRPTVKAKPNLMVLLDTSGSMDDAFMPDSMSDSGTYGYRSAQCNGVAYDPNITYTPPKYANGTHYPAAAYPEARGNGFDSSSSLIDLSDHRYYTYSGEQPKMGWVYTVAKGKTPSDNTFKKECTSDIGDAPGKDVFTRVNVSDLTDDKKTNYANWFSYYRKRFLLMRTAMGHAMSGLDDSYRVGFASIHENNFTDGGTLNFLGVKDFDASQKTKFYASLYGTNPRGATPLRKALANTGRYFGNRLKDQTDPMEYSCQRNYALLTTDGYWNSDNGTQLDGKTLIGQHDGAEKRPMRDDAIPGTITSYEAKATRNLVESYKNTRTRTRTSTKTEGFLFFSTTYTRTETCAERDRRDVVTTPQKGVARYTVTIIGENSEESPISYDPPLASTWPNDPAFSSTTTQTPITENACEIKYAPSTPFNTTSGWSAWSTWSAWSAWGLVKDGADSYNSLTPTSTSDPAFEATSTTPTSTDGTPKTLADVAQYYWATDLRADGSGYCKSSASGSEKNVCPNNVPTTTLDPAKHQHMNTFAIGMGVSGTLTYDKNYLTQASGAYVDLSAGTLNWPAPQFSEESGGGYSGSSGGPTNIDDLWHAAVNGRGQYYSAMDASSLSEAIAGVIASIDQTLGASSAAATSSLELIKGDNNLLYSASYTTGAWTGDLKAYKLKGETAEASEMVEWSSQKLLNNKLYTDRNIYFKSGATLAAFEYANLSITQKAYFNSMCGKTPTPTQCATLPPKAKEEANKGENLVNYLRGSRTHEAAIPFAEAPAPATPVSSVLYRKREHVLGDIINGAPVYVGKPPFKYADTGYADFAATPRAPMIYVAANDGMLHAFDANNGEEKWAYIPSAVMPKLYKLADRDYAGKHEYFVDGAPVMGDIQVGSTWKTILVGGLNRGGKAYYALDITDPASPKLLWEFSHENLGLSYGNPVITKNGEGTWIVAFASGYNNDSGDGKGRLFIVNANTGDEIVSGGIPTTAGDTTTPSGLAKINAWIEDATNNTATRFYGADLLGNIWRFDYAGLVEPKNKAMKLGTVEVSGTRQPITTKPLLLQAAGKPVVIVGTGRYLGEGDITDATVQSIYAIKDPLTDVSWDDIRTNTKFVKQTLTVNETTKEATISKNKVDWSTNAGWWVDLPNLKERISTPMSLQLTTLVVPSTIPSGDACTSGGSSWLYYLNAATGSIINNKNGDVVGSEASSDTVIVGSNWVEDSEGNLRVIYQDSQGQRVTVPPPVTGGGGATSAHRTSWRELVD